MRVLDAASLDDAGLRTLLARPQPQADDELERTVAAILETVRTGGDAAVADYTQRFDGCRPVAPWHATAHRPALPADLEEALDTAMSTVLAFHEAGRPRDYALETAPGMTCRARHLALDPVGLYVPAGTAPLPSTAVMLGVPARLAGCRNIVLATPPGPGGIPDPAVLAVAARLDIPRVLVAGGAQAIAAMAFGTETVPRCAKLFGPGNRFVAEAKRQAAARPDGAAMDLPAGPSELLVIADAGADAELLAWDLLSQAEHGPDSQVFLLTPDADLASAVAAAVERLVDSLPRAETARAALAHGAVLRTRDPEEALAISEAYAPEHLILTGTGAEALADRVRCAGSVFIGPWTPESLGDYVSGTNHTLPTGGWARSLSGLAVTDFCRRLTLQSATREGLAALGPAAARLAAHEGLDAHRQAVEIRLRRIAGGNTI